MTSRYNQLLQPQEYVSTYVPLPLEAMMKTGAMKQGQFDKAVEETYKMEDLMKNVNAIDKHQQYKKTLEDKYYPKIEELASHITKTGDLSKSNEIKKIAREWEHDPLRQELETSYANYNAYQKDKIAKGDKYGEWYDNYLPFQGSDAQGSIEGYRYTGMGEVQPHQELAINMMDKVKEDGFSSDIVDRDADGNIVGYKKNSKHILEGKIRGLAKGKTDSFLVTKQGRDFAAMLKHYNPNVDLRKAAEEYLYEAGTNHIHTITDSGNSFQYSPWALDDHKKAEDELSKRTYEALGQMGSQSTADLSDVAKAEPTSSMLAKVASFVDPNMQARGFLNMAKLIVPAFNTLPQLKAVEKQLIEDSKMSEDKLNANMEVIGREVKQQIGRDAKHFRETYGFSNPVFNQAYQIADFLTKSNKGKETPDYIRAKEVTASKDPNFHKLSSREQFEKVKEEMSNFEVSSKQNNLVVPTNKKDLDFKLQQLINSGATTAEKSTALASMGISANGKFIDAYTQKEVSLEEILEKEGGVLRYAGQLDNQNQNGPAMDYFQGKTGRYVSAGSLEERKANYLDWSINQTKNRYSKSFETPLLFDMSRDSRNFEEDGVTPKAGVPTLKVEENLKDGTLTVSTTVPDLSGKSNNPVNLSVKGARSSEEARILLAEQLTRYGYTHQQILDLGL